MRYRSPTIVALTALALAACSSTPPPPKAPPAPAARVVPARPVQQAEAALASASGSLVSGRVVLVPALQGIRLTGTIGGLRPGGVSDSMCTNAAIAARPMPAAPARISTRVVRCTGVPAAARIIWAIWTICVQTPKAWCIWT